MARGTFPPIRKTLPTISVFPAILDGSGTLVSGVINANGATARGSLSSAKQLCRRAKEATTFKGLRDCGARASNSDFEIAEVALKKAGMATAAIVVLNLRPILSSAISYSPTTISSRLTVESCAKTSEVTKLSTASRISAISWDRTKPGLIPSPRNRNSISSSTFSPSILMANYYCIGPTFAAWLFKAKLADHSRMLVTQVEMGQRMNVYGWPIMIRWLMPV